MSAAYGPEPRLAVVAVAGSVGAGTADRWSDLEVDCYWTEPPTEQDRRRPISALGAELEAFWDYDEDDAEWSEDYRIGSLPVTVSNFTVATVETFLDAVIQHGDLDPVKHYRLAAISRCRALRGFPTLSSWRDRAAAYPDTLVLAMVESVLSPDRLPGWSARDALAERADTIALYTLASALAQGVYEAVLSLNRTFRSHRLVKWQRETLRGLAVVPDQFEVRLAELWEPDPIVALAHAETLIEDTIDLAESQLGRPLTALRTALAERRNALEPPREI